ncbi:MAG: hypothetical protein AAF591_04170 [Verrucomicrobiota bacterium]
MKALSCCLMSVFFVSLSWAQSDRFEILKKQRDDAIERAVAPINKRYVEELEKLVRVLTASGELEEALQLKKEIASIKGLDGGRSDAPSGDIFTEEYLIGTRWEMVEGGVSQELEFQKGFFTTRKKDSSGEWVAGGEREWVIEDLGKRQIRIFWNSGERVATLTRRFDEMHDGRHKLLRLEE